MGYSGSLAIKYIGGEQLQPHVHLDSLLGKQVGDYRGVSLNLRIQVPHARVMRLLRRRGVSPSTSPDTSRPRDYIPVKRRAVPGSPSAHGTGATARGFPTTDQKL